ncbi:MAG: hypothetical protein IJG86_00655 [Clostridia bacterium]|nr:hypothetical protein [Clostridia bacterium]
MAESSEVLRLRALLGFYKEDNVTVTGLSRTLGEEKYTISRLLSSLEEEGLVDRSNNRHPKLTEQGLEVAERYAERVHTMENYLLYKGVSGENAPPDAIRMALHLSDQSAGVFRKEEAMEAVKYEFRDRRKFSGSEFFPKLPDGEYRLSFIIYREKANAVTNVSMVNEGFEHPAILSVTDGVGTIRLHATTLNARSAKTGAAMKGKVKSLKYFDSGDFIDAEQKDDTISFPAESFSFYNLRPGFSPLLHGTLPIRITANIGTMYMPDSIAFFSVFL